MSEFLSLPINTLAIQAAKIQNDDNNSHNTEDTLTMIENIFIDHEKDQKSKPFLQSILTSLDEIMMAIMITFYQQHMNAKMQQLNEVKLSAFLCKRRRQHKLLSLFRTPLTKQHVTYKQQT